MTNARLLGFFAAQPSLPFPLPLSLTEKIFATGDAGTARPQKGLIKFGLTPALTASSA